jgi:dCMP deaminase
MMSSADRKKLPAKKVIIASRPSYDEYFMELAKVISKRSTCLRRRVGAVIVKEDRILATGYNGPPRGITHCSKVGCFRSEKSIPSGEKEELCRAVHAEQNAIIQAALFGINMKDAILYITHRPCLTCTKLLISAGIQKIIYDKEYKLEPLAKALVREARIEIKKYKVARLPKLDEYEN